MKDLGTPAIRATTGIAVTFTLDLWTAVKPLPPIVPRVNRAAPAWEAGGSWSAPASNPGQDEEHDRSGEEVERVALADVELETIADVSHSCRD